MLDSGQTCLHFNAFVLGQYLTFSLGSSKAPIQGQLRENALAMKQKKTHELVVPRLFTKKQQNAHIHTEHLKGTHDAIFCLSKGSGRMLP